MTHHARASGRALPIVLAVLALGVIVFLLAGDFLGGSGSGGGGDGEGGHGTDLLGADGAGDGADGKAPAPTAQLGGLYGEGDAGAIRLRLLWVGTRKPLAGQSVQLVSRRGAAVTEVPSDAEGRVLFAGAFPAKGYSLHIQGKGFSEVWLRGISVHAQAVTDLGDLILGEDVVLRGRVVDAMGRPVPGTAVSIHTIERGMANKGMLFYMAEQARSVPAALGEVESDPEGYFAFRSLDDGMYNLVARRPGYASRHEADVIVARKRGAGVLMVVLGNAGRVTGTVKDEEGKPIANARVIAIRDVRRMSSNPLQREIALTAEDGSYLIDTLTAGVRYRFGVLAEGYGPVYEMNGVEIGETDLEKDFTLVRGGDFAGVVTDEATGKPVAGAQVAIFVGRMGFGGGRRSDGEQKAAADTRVTDEQGRFRFASMTPGPVASGVVKAAGYVSATYSMWPPPGNAWPSIVAGETQEVEVALRRGGTVKGVVRAAEGQAPIQGADVTLMLTDFMAGMSSFFYGTPSATTTEDGGFQIEGVPPGKYRLLGMAEGFTPAGGTEGIELEVPMAGGTVERDVTLISAGAVEGKVLDPQGEPVVGVRIRLRAGPREEGASGGRSGRRMSFARRMLMSGRNPADLSDEEGRFRLEGVGTGSKWIVYGESQEYVSGESKPFEVAAGETETVTLTMLPGGALRGRVVDENGRWLAGARVQVGRLPEDLAGRAHLNAWRADRSLDPRVFTTDEEGRFLATNLKPGRTIVKASKDDYITYYKRDVVIKPGETVENYMVALSAGEVVEGTVLGSDGQPLQGAMVAVTSAANPGSEDDAEGGTPSDDVEPAMYGRTDAQGRYKIEHVRPGTFNVVIWFAPGHNGWPRGNDPNAIHRGVTVPARDVDFKLTRAEAQAPGAPRRGR